MRSIREDLTRSLLVALVVLLLVGGFAAYLGVQAFLVSQFDAALLGKGRALAALVEFEHGRILVELTDEMLPAFERSEDPDCFQIWIEGGEALERSHSLHGQDLPHRALPGPGEEIFELELPDGRRARAVAIRFRPHVSDDDPRPSELGAIGQMDVELVLARSRARLDDASRASALGIVLLESFVLVVVLLLVRSRVRAGLTPLVRLAAEVGRIDETRLDRRLETRGLPEELKVISEKVNAVLEKLQAAFERERRFASSAAHELRTPIAEMRTLLEVSLEDSGSLTPEERVQDLKELHQITAEMGGLVETLLSMTRSDPPGARSSGTLVALDRAVADAIAIRDEDARAKELRFSVDVPARVGVWVEREAFTVILRNLIGNAVDHSPGQGRIDVAARSEGSGMELRITNEAPAIRQEDLPRLFEPFWRKEESRTDSRHRGLGLAIVESLVRVLGWRIETGLDPSGRLSIALSIPRSEPMPAEADARSPRRERVADKEALRI